MDRSPPLIPDSELLRRIGRGSYGEVWLARSVTGLYRAVKIIYRNQFEDDRPYEREFTGIKRFEPISRAHESQLDILHVGRNDSAGYFYYIMELADDADSEGERPSAAFRPESYLPKTLKAVLAIRDRLHVSEVLPIGLSLADALTHLHGHGLVHRDIKPSNIIFVNGRPKLADIGLIASADATRSFVGTEGFIPREGPGTPQADIFALGKVLYEACTGRDRLEFPSLPEALETLPDRAELRELNEVLLKACDPDPALRYASGADLKNDLELIRAQRSVRRLRILERTVRRGRKFAIVGSLMTLVIAIGWYQSHRFNRMASSQLARVYVKNGQERLEQNDWLGALPWFSKAMELENGLHDRETSHRLRIANTLEWCPQLAALYTHSHPARYAFFDARAERVLLCEPGTTAQVWDPLTDQPLTPKLEHVGQPFLGRFSPDAMRVATLSRDEGAARLWNGQTGALIGRPILHGKQVSAVAFSPNGSVLATAGEDGLARLWRADDGIEGCPALHHGAPISSVAFSNDGRRLLTIGGTNAAVGYVCIWDTNNGQRVGTPIQDSGSIQAAQFSPDGDSLATGTSTGEVCLWTLKPQQSRLWRQSAGYPVLRTLFNCDGTRLLVVSEWSALLLEGGTGQPIGPVIQSSGVLRSAQFSPDGSRFLLAGESRTALIYDSRTGRPKIPLLKHGGEIYSAFFVNDREGWVTASADGTVRRWKPSSGDQNKAMFAHRHPVKNLFITPDNLWVITIEDQGGLSRWPLTPGATVATNTRSLESQVTAGSLSTDGRDIVLARQDGALEVISADDFKTVAIGVAPAGGVQRIAPRPGTTQAALVARDDSVWLWDWRRGSLSSLPRPSAGVVSQIAFSADGRILALAAERAVLSMELIDSRQPVGTRIQHEDRIWHIGFDADGKRLVVSSEDRVMRWWNPVTGSALTPAIRGDGGINFAEFSADQQRVFTTSVNYDAMVWNASTGRPSTPPFKPRPGLTGAAFSWDDHWLAITCSEGTVQVWDASMGEAVTPPLATLGAVSLCRFSPNDRWLVTVEDGRDVICRPFLLEAAPIKRSSDQSTLLSGYRVDDHGFLVPLNRAEIIQLARETQKQGQ